MIKIDELLNGLLAALDGVIKAVSENDQEKVAHYSAYAEGIMGQITAQYSEMERVLNGGLQLKIFINNPSAWDSYSENVSRVIDGVGYSAENALGINDSP